MVRYNPGISAIRLPLELSAKQFQYFADKKKDKEKFAV